MITVIDVKRTDALATKEKAEEDAKKKRAEERRTTRRTPGAGGS